MNGSRWDSEIQTSGGCKETIGSSEDYIPAGYALSYRDFVGNPVCRCNWRFEADLEVMAVAAAVAAAPEEQRQCSPTFAKKILGHRW